MNAPTRFTATVLGMASILICSMQVISAASLTDRIMPELDSAWALAKAGQFDKQLEVYDRLLKDPEVSQSSFDGLVKTMAVGACSSAKRPDDVIVRAEAYLKGKLDDRDRATIYQCLIPSYIEKKRVTNARAASTKALALKGATDEQKDAIRKLSAQIPPDPKAKEDQAVGEALIAKGKALEAQGKTADALKAYEDVLKLRRIDDKTTADAAERILAIGGKNAEMAAAFARGVWEGLYEGEAVARVQIALARRLVRLDKLDDAQRVLSEVDPREAGKALEKQARELVGEELVKMGDEQLAAKDYDGAIATYKKALTMARTPTHRGAAQKGHINTLIAASRMDEALQVADTYIDDAVTDPEKAAVMVLKVQVFLSKDDLKGAQGCVDAIDQLKDAYHIHRVSSRVMVGKYVVARGKALEDAGKLPEAYKLYDELWNAPDTAGEIVCRATERKLGLMSKVLKDQEIVAECDRMLADKRMENMGHSILSTKMSAQLGMGQRDDARNTAALLLAHPSVYAAQKATVEKEFGADFVKSAKIDDATFAERVKGFEKTIRSSAAITARAAACRSLLQLYVSNGRAKEAEKRAQELLREISDAYQRQHVYRELYDIQVLLDDVNGAVSTARAMVGQIASPGVPDRARMMALADEVLGGLEAQLRTRNQLEREKDILAELQGVLVDADLPPEEGNWCQQRVFTINLMLGDSEAALAFYRANVDSLSAGPANLPPIVSALAKAAEAKPELANDAIAAARRMTAAAISADPKTAPSLRAAAASAFADLTTFLSDNKQKEKAEALIIELEDGLKGKQVDDAGKDWCIQTAFDGWCRLGEHAKAVRMLTQPQSASLKPTNAVPGMLLAAADYVGKEPKEVTAEDVAAGAAWYLEKNSAGLNTGYVAAVFNAVIQAYTAEGRPVEAARFIEKTVKDAPATQKNAEVAKYRAAEIYFDAKMPAEARRAAQELQTKWPTSRDKAQMLLARIDAGEDPDAAAKRFAALPKSAAGPELLSAGKEVIAVYQNRQEWAKAAGVYEQLAAKTDAPFDKQALLEGLYGMQVKSGNTDSATTTARSLLAMSFTSMDERSTAAVRAAASRVVTDLAKDLTKRGAGSKATVFISDLIEKSKAPGLDDGGKTWAYDQTFTLYCLTGNPTKALRFLKENLAAFKKAPGGLASAVGAAAQMADKAELREDQPVTMGAAPGAGALEDVFFGADWFFRNDPRQGAIYAEGIFVNLENTAKRMGSLVAVAHFFEQTTEIASPDAKFREKWRYRAAEIYFDSADYKEARRALDEVQKKWPSQWEKAELLLAKIDANESAPGAIERLTALHGKAKNSKVWFESGDQLIKLHQAKGEWAKAIAFQQELGAHDPRRLFMWAYDYQKNKQWENALPLYEQYRKNSPTDFRGYQFPAICLINLKRYPDAMALYDAAAQSFDGTQRESASLAAASICIENARDYAESERRFRSFTTTSPSSKSVDGAYAGLIRSLCGLTRFAEAADLSKKRLETSDGPADLTYRLLLSESLCGQGKGAEALTVLEEALAKHKLDRENLSVWMMLDFAQAHKAAGDAVKAAALANDVLKKYPDDERACERARELLK